MIFRRKKKEQSLAQIAARFVLKNKVRKLGKKDLEIEIDGQKFYFDDIPLKRK